nr:hypothetical protein [Tanacetum cinerariifolium]
FLSKSETSQGFDQIVDFLNAHTIQDHRFDDADGVECLTNEDIFAKLARMGYEKPPPKLTFYKAFFSAQWNFLIHTLVQCVSVKRIAWNELSCSMAFVVICLSTGRKLNFSKYIIDSMVRNVDNPSKFLMYLRFLQVVINNQVDDLTYYNTKYTSLALTRKVFANMQRVGKGFLGVETPLFASMLVQPLPQATEEKEEVEVSTAPAPPSPTSAPAPPTPISLRYSTSSSNSLYSFFFISDHYIEHIEFEIQEMVNIFSGKAY